MSPLRAFGLAALLVVLATATAPAAEPPPVDWSLDAPRLAPGPGVDLTLVAVTGRASRGGCAVPKGEAPAVLPGDVATAFAGPGTVTAVERARVPFRSGLAIFDALARFGEHRLFVDVRGRAADGRARLTVRDLGEHRLVRGQDIPLAPGKAAWFAAPFGRKGTGCLLVHAVGYAEAEASAPPAAITAVDAPEPLEREMPEFPEQAWLERRDGVITVVARVEPDGHVAFVRALDYPARSPDLAFEAVEAVSRWTFRPARVDGTAVPCWITTRLTFERRY